MKYTNMWSTILCTDVIGIDYLFNSRNLNQLIFVEKGLLSRFLPTFAKTCTLYPKPFGMPINTEDAERYMLLEHVPNGKPFIHWDFRRFRYKVHVVAQKGRN